MKKELSLLFRKGLLVSALSLVGTTFTSEARAECNRNICKGEIKQLFQNSSILYILPDGDLTQLNCEPRYDKYIIIRKSEPHFKEVYTMVMAALLTKKKAGVRIHETPGEVCKVMYTTIE